MFVSLLSGGDKTKGLYSCFSRMIDMGAIDKVVERVQNNIKGEGEPLVFSNGFAVGAKIYDVLDMLADRYRIIPVDINCTNFLDNPPTTSDEAAEMTYETLQKLGVDRYHVLGHSTGGLVALKLASKTDDVLDGVVVSPVVPMEYGLMEQLYRALTLAAHEHTGQLTEEFKEKFSHTWKALKNGSEFNGNFLRNISASLDYMKDLREEDYENVDVHQPFLALLSTEDEYYDFEKNLSLLHKKVHNLDARMMEGYNHDGITFFPETYAGLISEHYER